MMGLSAGFQNATLGKGLEISLIVSPHLPTLPGVHCLGVVIKSVRTVLPESQENFGHLDLSTQGNQVFLPHKFQQLDKEMTDLKSLIPSVPGIFAIESIFAIQPVQFSWGYSKAQSQPISIVTMRSWCLVRKAV
jgi:hypothetical protein